MHRGVAVLETAHVLRRECCPLLRDRLAGESLEQFAILGWCIELVRLATQATCALQSNRLGPTTMPFC